MKQTWILIILGAIIIIGGFVFFKGQRSGGQYCQSDGTLGTTKPVQSHRGYCLKSNSQGASYTPGQAATYSYSVVDDQGNTLKDFDTVHEKIMHLIVVRKDLQQFQHVHPDFNRTTGEFTLADLTFATDGPYRLFADFTPTSSQMGPDGMKLPITLNEDVTVGTLANHQAQPLGSAENRKAVADYTVNLTASPTPLTSGTESMVSFTISQNGRPVINLEKYLGALGHSVILKEGTLDFLHAHALSETVENQTGRIDFMAAFPTPGKYKAFTQFQHQGKVTTADFVVEVGQGTAGSSDADMEGMGDMPGMNH